MLYRYSVKPSHPNDLVKEALGYLPQVGQRQNRDLKPSSLPPGSVFLTPMVSRLFGQDYNVR